MIPTPSKRIFCSYHDQSLSTYLDRTETRGCPETVCLKTERGCVADRPRSEVFRQAKDRIVALGKRIWGIIGSSPSPALALQRSSRWVRWHAQKSRRRKKHADNININKTLSAKIPECWASDSRAAGLRIEISPQNYLVLPFDQFLLAELLIENPVLICDSSLPCTRF